MPRPKFHPTEEQRRLVKSMAGMGTVQEEIAKFIGVRSPKTLRKHFRSELDHGAIETNHNVKATLYKMAISGQCPAATIFWLKTRCGFHEKPPEQAAKTPPPPFIVTREVEAA